MKIGTKVQTPWNNTGRVVATHKNLAKVILDKDQSTHAHQGVRESEDLDRSAWYFCVELAVIHAP